jgi:hypothetical protein
MFVVKYGKTIYVKLLNESKLTLPSVDLAMEYDQYHH